MDTQFPQNGSTVPAEFISQATPKNAAKPSGGRLGDGHEDMALAADPSAIGALNLLLQQIEFNHLDTVICPSVLAHAKRIQQGAADQCQETDSARAIALCETKIAEHRQKLATITSRERWEEKHALLRQIDVCQRAMEILRITAR